MAEKKAAGHPVIRYVYHKTGNNDVQYFYHKHLDHCELIYLEQGTGAVTLDGRQHSLAGGELLVLNQKVIHGEEYQPVEAGGLSRWVVGISGLALPGREKGQLLADDKDPVVRPGLPPEKLTALFELLEAESAPGLPGGERVCAGLLAVLLAWLDRWATGQEPQPDKTDTTMALAYQIQAYIKIHFCENLTLQALADRFYISPFYLAHIMKACLGISTIKYITHLRVVEARDLLRTTKYPVKQIAQMVGYQNSRYFLNVFKKSTGMSPKEYRNSTKELLME